MAEPAPCIGLAIPYAGRVDYLEVAVESVLRQTDANWALLIVPDGPDVPRVEDWIRQLGDPRVHCHRQGSQLGAAGNFQRCLDLMTASHVVFLGCDDALLPSYVEVTRRALSLFPSADAVQPGVEVMDARGNTVRPLGDRVKRLVAPRQGLTTRRLTGEPLMSSLMLGNWTYFPSICWRRERIAAVGFRQDLPVTLDLALLAHLVLDDGDLVTTPQVTFRYRRHATSLSSKTARMGDRFHEEAELFRELAELCAARGWWRAARAARLHPTSRLHAAMRSASSILRRDRAATASLLRHTVAR